MQKQSKYIKILLQFTTICAATHAEAGLFNKCDLTHKESLNIKSFDRCSQSKLDSFYRELSAGSLIPDSVFDGSVEIARPDMSGNFNILKALRNIEPNFIREAQENFLEQIWKGKIFYRVNPNEAILFNRIHEVNQLKERFPAHVYYGRSLFDSKKLSIVIDYTENQDIEGYRPSVDWLVNKKGFAVRDEIRKVNKSLYLGRAYVKGKFLLNFVLEEAR